jgi:TolA-binding protein
MKASTALSICMASSLSFLLPAPAPAAEGQRRAAVDRSDLLARRQFRTALGLMESGESERAVRMLQQILDGYPTSQVKWDVYLALGKHALYEQAQPKAAIDSLKRVTELEQVRREEALPAARAEAQEAGAAAPATVAEVTLSPQDAELVVESLYHTGVAFYYLNTYNQAFAHLRRVTRDYPNSVWANQAYYYIGMAHFLQKNWTKAVKYLSLVGTFVDPEAENATLVEAGQRLFVRIVDNDLAILYKQGGHAEVTARSRSGDEVTTRLIPLSPSEGLFIASVPTELGVVNAEDRRLQITGGDQITVTYVDSNTQGGEENVTRTFLVDVVSTANIGFTDATYEGKADFVQINKKAYLSLKDADLDTGPEQQSVTYRVVTRFKELQAETGDDVFADDFAALSATNEPEEVWRDRDEVRLTLTEQQTPVEIDETTGEPVAGAQENPIFHTSRFNGSVDIIAYEPGSTVDRSDMFLQAQQGDQVHIVIEDDRHVEGDFSRVVEVSLNVLGEFDATIRPQGQSSDDARLQAEKNTIEAEAFLELGKIFNGMGLEELGKVRLDQGLQRVNEVIKDDLAPPEFLEQAFRLRWELQLEGSDLDGAIATCLAFNQAFPDSRFADEALLSIGKTYLAGEQYFQAVGVFEQILALEVSDAKPEAQYLIAETKFKQASATEGGNIEVAIPYYKKVAETYPDSSFAGESLARQIEYYIRKKDYIQGNDLLEQVFIDHPDKSWLDGMLRYWVVLSFRMGDFRKSKEKAEQLIFEYPDSPHVSKVTEFLPAIEKRLEQN